MTPFYRQTFAELGREAADSLARHFDRQVEYLFLRPLYGEDLNRTLQRIIVQRLKRVVQERGPLAGYYLLKRVNKELRRRR